MSKDISGQIVSSIDGVFGSAGLFPVSKELHRLLSEGHFVHLVVTTVLKGILYESDIEKIRARAYATAKEVNSILVENPKTIDGFRILENAREEKSTPIEEVAKSISSGEFSESTLLDLGLSEAKILDDAEYKRCYRLAKGQVHIETKWECERRMSST